MMEQTTRRSFFQTVGGGLALGLTAASYRALAGVSPNERIQVGFIGLGAMGTGRLKGFMQHPDVLAAAVCDVDRDHLDRAVAAVEQKQGRKPQAFRDFRKLLEDKDLDAVMIATPDHWHALPTIAACKAGKDVFVEKPLCYSIGEGRAMMRAAFEHKRITQLGTHIHNDYPNYRRVVELVQSGMLGKVKRVYCWITSSDRSLGKPADAPPPAELDYDFWLGPAPKRPYNPNRSHRSFRYFWDYSGGIFIDFWCHYTDVVYWALGLKAPKSVSAAGGRFFQDDNAETPDTIEVLYEYPEVILTWTVHPRGRPGFGHMDAGVIFEGSEATLATTYTRHELYVKGKKVEDFKRPEPTIPDSPGHIREFLDSIKSRKRTTCDIEYAYTLTKGGLLGNLAYRTGERLYWDDQRQRIAGHSQANKMVTRHYRKPWRLA